MDIDKKVSDIEDKTSVLEGRIEHDAVDKARPASLAHLSDNEMDARSRKLTRKVDVFSEP